MRIKAHLLYILIVAYVIILASYFLFGDTGVITINKKIVELEQIEDNVLILRAEIEQMKLNMERLKSDREYIISSAKSYGYLEGRNEKVVRILNNEVYVLEGGNSRDGFKISSLMGHYDNVENNNLSRGTNTSHNDSMLSSILPILLISVGSILVYLFVKYQINSRKRVRA